MSTIPVMDRMGAELEAALRRRPRRRVWWRAHPLVAALAALAAVALPAAGSQVDWASLVRGETALPTQARPGLRTVLSSGDRYRYDAWQLVVYKARIGTADGRGPVGLCAFVTLAVTQIGSGRCSAADRAPDLLIASRGDDVGVIAGLVSASARRVELTLEDGRRLAVAPQAAPAALLRERGLPADLRYFVVDVTGRGEARLAGARVRDAAGAGLASFGRPRPLPASAPLLSAPVSIDPEETP
jgi:hypothetical protein